MAMEVASLYNKGFFSHQSIKHRVTVIVLCLKTAAMGQTTHATSQSINQLLSPFNYNLLFYVLHEVLSGIKS